MSYTEAMSQFQRYILGMVLIILGVNIVGSWTVQYLTWQKIVQLEEASNLLATELQKKTDVGSVSTAVPTSSSAPVRTATPTPVPTPTQAAAPLQTAASPSVQAPPANTPAPPQIREQTIFIGSGSSSDTNWRDIDTASIELNSYNYPSVRRVVFEATLSILGGEAGARLINKTTGEVIYPSAVSHNTSTATTKLSGSFNLESGSNIYIVQLRSSSNEMAVLDGARLRMFY